MIVQTRTQNSNNFQPIVLEITIETRDEFNALYHRLNAKGSRFHDYTEKYLLNPVDDAGLYITRNGKTGVQYLRPLFRALNNEALDMHYELGMDLPEGKNF